MKIDSIQIGTIRDLEYRGLSMKTGIFKMPVTGPVLIQYLNIRGDRQADLTVHGGKDKAVYAYSSDAYSVWKTLRPQDLFEYGAMGENLSVDHMSEQKMYIGDTFEIGDAVLQAVQPRFPCQKLAAKFHDPLIIRQFMKFERPGVYFRVLKEGMIEQGQELKLIEQEEVRVSIHEMFILSKNISIHPTRLKEILKLKSLNESWREQIEMKLKGE